MCNEEQVHTVIRLGLLFGGHRRKVGDLGHKSALHKIKSLWRAAVASALDFQAYGNLLDDICK